MSDRYCPFCQNQIPQEAHFCPFCGQTSSGSLTGRLTAQFLLDDRYLIVRLVGQGGMGAVYQAVDTRIQGRVCAVKEMSIHALPPQERATAVQNFEQEAQLLARLRHPYLPQVHDFFQDGSSGRYYLVMDFVEGETLGAILARQGALPEQVVRDWGSQLCEVLHYLHQQSPPIIFRDLKPGNIMLDRSGHIKLIDFGIARFFKPMQTKDTQVIGTPGFAAPEQYGQGQTDVRSDIYGLGVTLLTLLTGYDPAQNPFALPEARQLNPAVSAQITAVIQRATQMKPEQRWQSTADLRQALVTGKLSGKSAKDKTSEGVWQRLRWAGAALLLILLGASVWAIGPEKLGWGGTPATRVPTVETSGMEVTRLVMATNTPTQPVMPTLAANVALMATAVATPTLIPTLLPTLPSPTPTALPSPTSVPTPVLPDLVVFQSNRDGDSEIYHINLDGSNLQKLTDNGWEDQYPAVSPDGRRVVFQSDRNGDWEVYVMDVDGRNQTRLTNHSGMDRLPTWSPDGRQIAFISNRSGQFAVYVMDADGQNTRRVTNTGERDGHVSWSVNGQLAFNTGGDSSRLWRIVVTDLAGGNLQSLTENGNWSPEWSPDGRTLLFVSSRIGGDTNPGIFVMDADGRNQRLLFDSPNYEWGARWSGDGQLVLFTRSVGNQDSIYYMPASGGVPTLLTERGSYPAWVNGR